MKQKIARFIRSLRWYILVAVVAAFVGIVLWERIDDAIEEKWYDMTIIEYHRPTTTPEVILKSDEERRIEEIKNSKEAEDALNAYAKGVYAEELRVRSEALAEEARKATLPLP